MAALINAAEEYDELLYGAARLAGLAPSVREALSRQDLVALANALDELDTWLATSDGFVPADSQIPTGGNWSSGAAIHSAHPLQPSDPLPSRRLIRKSQPGMRLTKLSGVDRAAFSDHTIWNDLLAPVALKPNFDLRAAGVDPATVDLSAVTDASDFYTADLQENGIAGVTAQIGRVVTPSTNCERACR